MAGQDRQSEVNAALAELADGKTSAAEQLMPLVYDELRSLAGRYMKQFPGANTLQPTALVHEAFLRLANPNATDFKNRAHFMAVCAKVMRGILVDHARRKDAEKHGGRLHRMTLVDDVTLAPDEPEHDINVLAVHAVLERLEEMDARKGRVVELRLFGGLTLEQVAAVLNVARSTVSADWRMARAWVARELLDVEAG